MNITYETAHAICVAYEEIRAGEKMLEQLKELQKNYEPLELRDAFGRRRGLQLGVPSGENGHRLLDVDPKLALAVIEAHIANKKALLATINQKVIDELKI